MSTPEAQQALKSADDKMKKAAEVTHHELNSLRTGRASPSFVEGLVIDAYGTKTPLNQLATINVPEPRLLVVQPYDRSIIGAIEKAIMASDLGLTPVNDGKIVRLAMPSPTEERRKQLAKAVHKIAEESRVVVRNLRREANDRLKAMAKDKKVSEDEERRSHDQIQKATDKFIAKIDELLKKKEQEILSF